MSGQRGIARVAIALRRNGTEGGMSMYSIEAISQRRAAPLRVLWASCMSRLVRTCTYMHALSRTNKNAPATKRTPQFLLAQQTLC